MSIFLEDGGKPQNAYSYLSNEMWMNEVIYIQKELNMQSTMPKIK
jgi:hypothetical protein